MLHRGCLPNLLQYYIGGFFKVFFKLIWKGFDHFQYYICFYVVLKGRILSQIWDKFSEYVILGKYPYIISILHRVDLLNLLQYYNRGEGSTSILYYVINGRPLMRLWSSNKSLFPRFPACTSHRAKWALGDPQYSQVTGNLTRFFLLVQCRHTCARTLIKMDSIEPISLISNVIL